MIKKLVKIVLLGLLALIASKGFIAFTVDQAITSLKDKHADDALFTYQWVSSSLDGMVSIKGVEITPYAMKKTFSIDEIQFVYNDYVSLLTSVAGLGNGQLTGLKKVLLPNVETALTGKSLKALLAEQVAPIWLTPLALYGCDDYKTLSPKEYELMGVKQHKMSLHLAISQDNADLETMSVGINSQELGEFNVAATFPKHALQGALNNHAYHELKLYDLNLEYKDAGFFRRLNILCNQRGPENRAIFSINAASQWKDAMFSTGLLVNQTLINVYADYLLQGGAISLTAQADDGLQLKDLPSLLDKELFSYFDANLALNGKAVVEPQLYLDSQTLFPAPVENKQVEIEVTAPEKRPAGYREIALTRVAEFIDRKIRVVMADGKRYEGLLTQTSEYNLQLTQNLAGGVVHYPLMLNQIETFDVWFNQEI